MITSIEASCVFLGKELSMAGLSMDRSYKLRETEDKQ